MRNKTRSIEAIHDTQDIHAMTGHCFALNGAELIALPSGALWWPERRLLAVSDLHLGKSERIARRGGTLLPPYDTTETLIRLHAEVEAHQPWTVVCLGDSFDDVDAERGMRSSDQRLLLPMLAGRRWIWIAGNHDPGPVETGGTWVAEHATGPLTFRHVAEPGTKGEISGHYHPKVRLPGHSGRAAFLVTSERVILPAFGTYTGGLALSDPAFAPLLEDGALALMVGRRIVPVPVPEICAA